jgi:hypothetical protein
MTDIVTQLSISGVNSEPAFVAVIPNDPCANKGMNEIPPNIAMPPKNPAETETATVLFLKR